MRGFLQGARAVRKKLRAGTDAQTRDVLCLAADGDLLACGMGELRAPEAHGGRLRLFERSAVACDVRLASSVTALAVCKATDQLACATAFFARHTATAQQHQLGSTSPRRMACTRWRQAHLGTSPQGTFDTEP